MFIHLKNNKSLLLGFTLFFLNFAYLHGQVWTGNSIFSPASRAGTTTIGTTFVTPTPGPSAKLNIQTFGDINDAGLLRLNRTNPSNPSAHNIWDINLNSAGSLLFQRVFSSPDISLPNNYVTRLLLTDSGQLGVGLNALEACAVSSHPKYKLFVNGGILAEEVKVELSQDWCDYVFKKDYNLLPLKKVKEHIDNHGFLHNTPSAEEIERDGLELKSMTINQQEKIEEFLHVIALDKKLQELEARNEELNNIVNNLKK